MTAYTGPVSTPPQVRAATADDAPAALEVLRASITELCTRDHQNDRETLERWLDNKTIPNFERWVSDPDNVLVVAEREGRLDGVGLVRSTGDIHLCYVRPEVVGTGTGGAILARLEAAAREWGLVDLRLSSTLGARAFYERKGFIVDGEPQVAFGSVRHYPYRKAL